MRDLNFFYDDCINDLNAGQITRAILRSTWPETDKEIYEHELRKGLNYVTKRIRPKRQ